MGDGILGRIWDATNKSVESVGKSKKTGKTKKTSSTTISKPTKQGVNNCKNKVSNLQSNSFDKARRKQQEQDNKMKQERTRQISGEGRTPEDLSPEVQRWQQGYNKRNLGQKRAKENVNKQKNSVASIEKSQGEQEKELKKLDKKVTAVRVSAAVVTGGASESSIKSRQEWEKGNKKGAIAYGGLAIVQVALTATGYDKLGKAKKAADAMKAVKAGSTVSKTGNAVNNSGSAVKAGAGKAPAAPRTPNYERSDIVKQFNKDVGKPPGIQPRPQASGGTAPRAPSQPVRPSTPKPEPRPDTNSATRPAQQPTARPSEPSGRVDGPSVQAPHGPQSRTNLPGRPSHEGARPNFNSDQKDPQYGGLDITG